MKVHPPGEIPEVKDRRPQLRGGRSDRRAGDAESGEAELPENQRIVQHHVGQHHHHRIDRQDFRLRNADEECPEHHAGESEKEAEHPPVEILNGRVEHRLRLNHGAQYMRRQQQRRSAQDCGQNQQKSQTGIEDFSDFTVTLLTVPPRDQDLRADAETESQHENRQKIDASQRGRAQLDFADPPEESGIGKADHMFHQHTDQHRKRHQPYFSIRITHNPAIQLPAPENTETISAHFPAIHVI